MSIDDTVEQKKIIDYTRIARMMFTSTFSNVIALDSLVTETNL